MTLRIQQMACGNTHSLVLLSDGSVSATGHNFHGNLGDGTTVNKSTWTSVIPSGVTQVAAGWGHSLVLISGWIGMGDRV
jgi:alpha-tubulin suppressor-like RCC1 family protein